MNSHTQNVPNGEALKLVANETRRNILRQLIDNGEGTVEFDELQRAVGDERPDRRPSSSDEAVRLHHLHLPKLAEAGVIDYDPRQQTVRYHPTESIEKLVSFIETELH